MEKILRKIEKLIPKSIYTFFQPAYHYFISLLGAIVYKFPARKLYVIGVTGTKGKSTTTEIINSILETAGYKTATTSTIRFKIGDKIKPNLYKMSMPGRFFMQKFLHEAIANNCTHVVLEITSEGAKQFRNKFIDLDAFVFTNLQPEHIESHGSYEKYRSCKASIAEGVNNRSKEDTIIVVNGDDKEKNYFNKTKADHKLEFHLSDAKNLDLKNGINFIWENQNIKSSLRGEFNVSNILAAATLTKAMGIPVEKIKQGIEKISEVAGRVQFVEVGQNYDVVVDYAHTPDSLEALYKAFPDQRKICILGNTGGGRDTWKRPVMAKIAEKYCDEIILTNEDPYDEDPEKIISEMREAITDKPVKVILDRRSAIHDACKYAKATDIVLISGKGTDPYIMEANGKKTPWSDYKVAKEEIEKLQKDKI